MVPKAAIFKVIFGKFSSIFEKNNSVFDDFSNWELPNVLQNSEKSLNIAKIWKNLAIFTNILMATFETKTSHSASNYAL